MSMDSHMTQKNIELKADFKKVTDLIEGYGKKLLGRVVITQQEGGFPGGFAYVTSLRSDDPNIAMYVRGHQLGDHNSEGRPYNFDMGIFNYEKVMLTRLDKIPQSDDKRLVPFQKRLYERALRLREKAKKLK